MREREQRRDRCENCERFVPLYQDMRWLHGSMKYHGDGKCSEKGLRRWWQHCRKFEERSKEIEAEL